MIKAKKIALMILSLLLFFNVALADQPILKVPPSLLQEHNELMAMLQQAIASGGKTGQAAQEVAKLMLPHFKEQLDFVYPPLGLLPILTTGDVTPEMKAALPMIQKTSEIYSQLLDIHAAIIVQANNLVAAAHEENKPVVYEFVDRFKIYARRGEEVIYPAAILLGEFIKLKMGS